MVHEQRNTVPKPKSNSKWGCKTDCIFRVLAPQYTARLEVRHHQQKYSSQYAITIHVFSQHAEAVHKKIDGSQENMLHWKDQ